MTLLKLLGAERLLFNEIRLTGIGRQRHRNEMEIKALKDSDPLDRQAGD